MENQELRLKDLQDSLEVLSDSRYPNDIGHQVIAAVAIKWLSKIVAHRQQLAQK